MLLFISHFEIFKAPESYHTEIHFNNGNVPLKKKRTANTYLHWILFHCLCCNETFHTHFQNPGMGCNLSKPFWIHHSVKFILSKQYNVVRYRRIRWFSVTTPRPETVLPTPESLFIFMDDQTLSAYIDAISNGTIKQISSCSSNPVGSKPDRIPCPHRQ